MSLRGHNAAKSRFDRDFVDDDDGVADLMMAYHLQKSQQRAAALKALIYGDPISSQIPSSVESSVWAHLLVF